MNKYCTYNHSESIEVKEPKDINYVVLWFIICKEYLHSGAGHLQYVL